MADCQGTIRSSKSTVATGATAKLFSSLCSKLFSRKLVLSHQNGPFVRIPTRCFGERNLSGSQLRRYHHCRGPTVHMHMARRERHQSADGQIYPLVWCSEVSVRSHLIKDLIEAELRILFLMVDVFALV